ncbi:hypothetical protein ACOQ1M_004711 [Salmonella enterica subsp. enterica serovar Infantis]
MTEQERFKNELKKITKTQWTIIIFSIAMIATTGIYNIAQSISQLIG